MCRSAGVCLCSCVSSCLHFLLVYDLCKNNFIIQFSTSLFIIINESEHIFHTFIDCNSGSGEMHWTQTNVNNNLDFRGTLFDNKNDFDINSLRTILDFFFLVCVHEKKKKKKTVGSTVAIKPMMNSSYCTIFSILYMLSCYVRSTRTSEWTKEKKVAKKKILPSSMSVVVCARAACVSVWLVERQPLLNLDNNSMYELTH